MKKRIVSVVLALCLCISSQSLAYAGQAEPLRHEEVLAEESTSGLVAHDSTTPTPTEVYEAMIALKDREQYKEGTPWTDDEPYSDSKGYYRWKGGPLGGSNIVAVGCVAFAFILSDEAFGALPARMYAAGSFTFEDIKVGDILRVNNDTHTVIVLEVNDASVIVAEGNISTGDHKGRIHWGRAISKEEVMNSASHYITRYPEGYIPPDDPEANVSIAKGTLDGGLAWNLTKAGTLTISGQGAMPDYSSLEEQPWREYGSRIRKVIIGNGVTNISSCAFWECGVLGVEIPSSVTAIGNNAFYKSDIVSINIPSSVKTIGANAFQQCQNLSAVTVSEGVESIGQNAFRACTKLASIELPASIGEVGAAAFFECQGLASATFVPGNKQVKLGDNMFSRCHYLIKVKLPKSIDCIGEGMFQNCLSLAGVEIPQGANSIGTFAFSSCSVFTTVIIPDSVETIGMAAFASCPLEDIYFTGTEEQWNSIGKSSDTIAVVSRATMHYNYVPPVTPNPDDDDDNNGDNDNISQATVTLDQTSYLCDGKPKTPAVTVKLDGKTLVLDTDYSVVYSDNINVGTAKVTVTGKGNYTGSKTVSFTITNAAGANPTASITCRKTLYKVVYGAKPFQINASSNRSMTFASSDPKIATVDVNTGKVSVKNTGVVTITIKAENVSRKVTVKVSPKKPSVKTAKAAKGRKLTVKWAKDKMASGYQVQVSTDKKFKKNVKSKKVSKTTYTFKKLKTGKKYYVKIRSYKKSGNETLYSAWSKVKSSSKIKK